MARHLGWMGALAVLGCVAEPGGSAADLGHADPTAAGNDGAAADGAAADGSSSSGGGSESDDGLEPDKLDVPLPETLGCQKIDFLFVIDDSVSMADEQQRLIDGFPGFMHEVQATIESFDYHVMVVTTGAQELSLDPCENMIGTGRVRDAAGEDCGLLEDVLNGQRFVDASHEDLQAAFSCIADVGADGDGDEKTIWSMADAITDQVAPGLCNEGFLRDDAILVVTIITDEEDSPHDEPPGSDHDDNSPGDPESWRAGLLAAKHGDDEAVVVLALVGDSDLPDGACEPYVHPDGEGAEPGVRIRELADSLPYGSWTSVCRDDYTDFFIEAVADIDTACTNFDPPG